jgi:hypothetical protein
MQPVAGRGVAYHQIGAMMTMTVVLLALLLLSV